jgi:hypothetical protein
MILKVIFSHPNGEVATKALMKNGLCGIWAEKKTNGF